MTKLISLSVLLTTLAMTGAAVAAGVKTPTLGQNGDAYVLKMPGVYNFHNVVDVLKFNLFERGWIVRDVHDVDIAMRKHGKLIHNKVLSVSKPEYLDDAIAQSQMNSLTLARDIVVFQEIQDVPPTTYATAPGMIVIAFIDPVETAKLVDVGKPPHGQATVKELRAAIEETAKFFTKSKTAGASPG